MDCCSQKGNVLSRFFKRKQDNSFSHQNCNTRKKLVLVGTPNVGKSVIFNRLTGAYVTVSNYPGTTVEIFRGTGRIGGEIFEIIDTPGMYSLMPITEEERVTRTLLFNENFDIVVHVVDAKNIERMLSMTMQLKEAGLPVMLVVNMMDEAERLGRKIDLDRLSALLDIPVVGTSAALNRGMDQMRRKVAEYVKKRVA
ncbi:FeoB small GTPase domain-containing protein [Thermosediminibacter oceani]|uniref:Small GTP-binding protein n=1 Tax=Thermosediminibacter oceani (strain ATCC BAA-1034 / DSM 16646 / JW/IW-1228P) TaxID=555079 RepID=D9S031_THEOJ|nr:FeoB small GTPase domain-containing protein [Thermosediminibacter oceani]ADL06959.1 small GTP-binding protein [Thermosediminibacter oceani DSM 16646]